MDFIVIKCQVLKLIDWYRQRRAKKYQLYATSQLYKSGNIFHKILETLENNDSETNIWVRVWVR